MFLPSLIISCFGVQGQAGGAVQKILEHGDRDAETAGADDQHDEVLRQHLRQEEQQPELTPNARRG